MRITPANLKNNPEFREILTLDHQNLLPFIIKQVKLKSGLNLFFWIFNLGFLLIAIISFFLTIYKSTINWSNLLLFIALGLVFFLLVIIPLHELIHLAGMKILGARRLSVSANLRQGMFYACAHDFVMNRKEFYFIALLPFVILNATIIGLIFSFSGEMVWGLWFIFILHSTGCLGDFALLNYFQSNKDKEIYTFDDTLSRTSYFFEKIN